MGRRSNCSKTKNPDVKNSEKVELEEEIEEASWFYQVLKHVGLVIMIILAQIGLQWLTQRCKRRSEDQYRYLCAKTPDDQPITYKRTWEEDDSDFEVIDSQQDVEGIQKNLMKQFEDEAEARKKEQRTILVTRSGDTFHLDEGCGHLKNYTWYKRTICDVCKEKIPEELDYSGRSEGTRDKTEVVITTKDKLYHHPTCKEAKNAKQKDKRRRCLDCEVKALNKLAEENKKRK